jgi:hypothetical protein
MTEVPPASIGDFISSTGKYSLGDGFLGRGATAHEDWLEPQVRVEDSCYLCKSLRGPVLFVLARSHHHGASGSVEGGKEPTLILCFFFSEGQAEFQGFRIDPQRSQEFEVLILDVSESLGMGGNLAVGEKPVEVSGPVSVETELYPCRAQGGQESSFQVDLKVEQDVEAAVEVTGREFPEDLGRACERFEPLQYGSRAFSMEVLGEEDEIVDCRMALDQIAGCGLNRPGDPGFREGSSEGRSYGKNLYGISHCAQHDDENRPRWVREERGGGPGHPITACSRMVHSLSEIFKPV